MPIAMPKAIFKRPIDIILPSFITFNMARDAPSVSSINGTVTPASSSVVFIIHFGGVIPVRIKKRAAAIPHRNESRNKEDAFILPWEMNSETVN